MAYPIEVKEKAIKLRKQGYSIKEVAKILHIAKSTSSVWLNSINLDERAQTRLQERQILGQYKSMQVHRQKHEAASQVLLNNVREYVSRIALSKELAKLHCALLYYCEGAKDTNCVKFTNSDPTVIKLFLYLLRQAFHIDETKLRITLHLHEYHDEQEQKRFWQEVTQIPRAQFHKTWIKPHTGKRKRVGYKGCITTVYYDTRLAKELMAIYNCFANDLASHRENTTIVIS